VARDPSRLTGVAAVARADLLDVATLAPAFAGIKTVIHCAALTADHKEPFPGGYRRINAEGTRNLVWAAGRAGVEKIVLLNGLGTRRGRDGSYMRTRWEMGEAVRNSGLAWLALQPSILFGDSAPYSAALARLARQSPVMPVLGGGRKLQPLWIEDLVTCLTRAAGSSRWDSRTIDLGGPDQLTFREMTHLVMQTIGVRRPTAPLPLALARVPARMMLLLPNPPLVPATLELFDFDNVTEPDTVQKTFGFEPRRIRDHFRAHGLDG
jgi:NADH dehydrogenase